MLVCYLKQQRLVHVHAQLALWKFDWFARFLLGRVSRLLPPLINDGFHLSH